MRIEVEPGKGLIFSRLVSKLLVFFNDNLLTLNLLPPTSKIIWDCMSLKMSSKRGFLLSTKKSSSEDDKWRDSSSSLFLFSWTSFFLPSELLGVGLGNLIWSISVGNFYINNILYTCLLLFLLLLLILNPNILIENLFRMHMGNVLLLFFLTFFCTWCIARKTRSAAPIHVGLYCIWTLTVDHRFCRKML